MAKRLSGPAGKTARKNAARTTMGKEYAKGGAARTAVNRELAAIRRSRGAAAEARARKNWGIPGTKVAVKVGGKKSAGKGGKAARGGKRASGGGRNG